MSERFYLPTAAGAPLGVEQLVVLADDEARHLAQVMRAKPGDRVTLFDGTGYEYVAEIVATRKRDVELRIVTAAAVDRELDFQLTLGVSLPKGERQKWLVEKIVELGVTALVPLVTARSVAQPTESTLERLRRSVLEASKQCGRNRLLRIEPAQAWAEWIASRPPDAAGWVAYPADHPAADQGGEFGPPPTADALERALRHDQRIAIGPEGGFDDDEVATAVGAGWWQLGLGRRIFRVETAAVVASTWIVVYRKIAFAAADRSR